MAIKTKLRRSTPAWICTGVSDVEHDSQSMQENLAHRLLCEDRDLLNHLFMASVVLATDREYAA